MRAATRELHERLDAGLPISAATPGPDVYVAHLKLLWQWLAPLQAWLDAHHDGPQDSGLLESVPRLQWLAADLLEFERVLPQVAAAPALPSPAGAAFRWGVCYVIEGSQLGGRVLLRKLAPRLGAHRLRLLEGGGAACQAERWKTFLDALCRSVRTPQDVADCCAGGRLAFERILALAGLDRPAMMGAQS